MAQAYVSETMRPTSVSHETIYRSLFIQARGALKKELLAASAAHASHAPFTPSHAEDRQPRQDHRCGIDQ